MNIRYGFLKPILLTLLGFVVACQPPPPQTPTPGMQAPKVTENDLVSGEIIQTKFFDQCNASSTFKSDVQFSDSSSRSNQQQLVLGANVTGGIELPTGPKAQITASIEAHFSKAQEQAQSHQESASIEVPPHTQQEYTITWRETRQKGTVEYIDAGVTKTIDFSYRIGLQLISARGIDIPCGEPTPTPVPANLLSQAAQVVDSHFRFLNNATNKDDLIQSWNLMTAKFQCNPSDQCQFANFQNWWWQWHVEYEVYDCGPNDIIVRYSLVPRNQPSATSTTIFYERYTLAEENGSLKMDEGRLVDGLDNGCMPVVGSE